MSKQVKTGKTRERPRNTQRPPPNIGVSGGLRRVSESKRFVKAYLLRIIVT